MVTAEVFALATAYVLSSCVMMFANSFVMRQLPFPGFILLWQNGFTVVAILIMRRSFSLRKTVADAGGMNTALGVALLFACVLFTGLQPFRSVSVESVIVGRSLGTAGVAVAEWILLGERLSLPSILSLCIVILGGFVYGGSTAAVSGILTHAGLWMCSNAVSVCCYNIAVRAASKRGSNSLALGLTNNLLSLLPLSALTLYESSTGLHFSSSANVLIALALSAVLGFAISVAGLAVRGKITATSFTLLANVNKLGTVGIAAYLRKEALPLHAWVGIGLTVVGAAAYSLCQDAAKRRPVAKVVPVDIKPKTS